MKPAKLGTLGTKFFAYIQAREIEIVRLGDLQVRLGLSPAQEQSLLKRLARSGFILRLKRGAYLVPERLPTGGAWQPNEYYLIAKYMQFVDAKYYIGGFVAIHHYGLTTQIPNVFTVYNDTFSGNRTIGKLKITFIKILPNRINASIDLQIEYRNTIVKIASLSRTLMDAVQDWSRYGTLPEAYGWIKRYIREPKLIKELIDITSQYGNQTTIRRIGFLLEYFDIKARRLEPLVKKLKNFHNRILLDPASDRKGKINKRWGVIDNVKQNK